MVEAPKLEFVFEARVKIAPTVDMGETPRGRQRMIPITGGDVEGPNFKAEVLAGGADWQILRPDGVTELTAQYVIRTPDGTQYRGHQSRAYATRRRRSTRGCWRTKKSIRALVYFVGSPTFASASPAT